LFQPSPANLHCISHKISHKISLRRLPTQATILGPLDPTLFGAQSQAKKNFCTDSVRIKK
jgi:hypothetical protein